ncbi:MAG: hypothetical protein HYX80_01020 [Chloroflexi bacterium]|nr:hypothetical protein [Chloroflexota bacterium]
MRLVIHIITGIIIATMIGGILLVLTLPRSGDFRMALIAWGILLAISGAIIGAIIGAKRRTKT